MSTFVRINNLSFYVRNFNNDFVLLHNQDTNGLATIGKAILDHKFKFIDEVIAAEQEIYLKLNSQKCLSNVTISKKYVTMLVNISDLRKKILRTWPFMDKNPTVPTLPRRMK